MQKIRRGPACVAAGADSGGERNPLCGKLDGNAAGRGERVALNMVEADGEGFERVSTPTQVLVETVRAAVEPFQCAGQFVVRVVGITVLPAAHVLPISSHEYE